MARTRRRTVAVFCCCALLMAAPGCSYVVVKGPPKEAPKEATPSIDCTESIDAPIVDTILAVTGLAVALALGAAYSCPPNEMCMGRGMEAIGAGVVGGLAAGVGGVSAWYGYSKTSKCRSAVACTHGDQAECDRLHWNVPPPASAPAVSPQPSP